MIINKTKYNYDIAFTCLVNFDFKFEALFLCIIFLLVSLSNIATTFGNKETASFLLLIDFNFVIAFLVVL